MGKLKIRTNSLHDLYVEYKLGWNIDSDCPCSMALQPTRVVALPKPCSTISLDRHIEIDHQEGAANSCFYKNRIEGTWYYAAIPASGENLVYVNDVWDDGQRRDECDTLGRECRGVGSTGTGSGGGPTTTGGGSTTGNLNWFRHDGWQDGTVRWAGNGYPSVVGHGGWQAYKSVFAAGNGIIYAIEPGGNLLWYRHDGAQDGRIVGQGLSLSAMVAGRRISRFLPPATGSSMPLNRAATCSGTGMMARRTDASLQMACRCRPWWLAGV